MPVSPQFREAEHSHCAEVAVATERVILRIERRVAGVEITNEQKVAGAPLLGRGVNQFPERNKSWFLVWQVDAGERELLLRKLDFQPTTLERADVCRRSATNEGCPCGNQCTVALRPWRSRVDVVQAVTFEGRTQERPAFRLVLRQNDDIGPVPDDRVCDTLGLTSAALADVP
jgi:hypothetical protein